MTDDTELVPVEALHPDEELLADIRRKRGIGRATKVLLGLLVVALAFLGGVALQKHQGGSSSSAVLPSGFPANLAAAFGRTSSTTTGGGAGRGATTGSGTTIGTVKLVDGDNVYVSDFQGNVVKVTTGRDTTVKVSKSAAVGDLQPGMSVVVQGTTGSGSTMRATSISQNSAGLVGGGASGLPAGLPSGFPGGGG